MLVGDDVAAFLERAQVDRDAAARDGELLGDVRHARPTAILATEFIDRQKVVRGAVRQLVRFKFLPSFHRCSKYSPDV